MEGYAPDPYHRVYLFEALGRPYAADAARGARLRLSADCRRFLESARAVRPDQAAPVAGARQPPAHVALELESLAGDPGPWACPEDESPPAVHSLTLHVAGLCNLACEYCFEDWPHLRGLAGPASGLMSGEVARSAIDYLMRESGGARHVSISFFGGEPLLAWPVVRSATLYARQAARDHGKEVSFHLTTNGTRLSAEIQAFLVEHDFEVILSLDGPPAVHDRFRVFRDGSPSSEIVLRHALEMRQRIEDARPGTAASVTVRGTYFRPTLDFVSSVYYLADKGFESISVENGVVPADRPFALRLEDVDGITRRYDRLVARMADGLIQGTRRFRHFHMIRALEALVAGRGRKRECGAGTGYLAIGPDGTLYPCHKFVGDPDLRVGTLAGGVERPEIGRALWDAHAETKEPCNSCWARYLCGGGCHADAYLASGGFQHPEPVSCALLRHRMKLAFYLLDRLESEAPAVLQALLPGMVHEHTTPLRNREVRVTAHGDGVVLYDPLARKIHQLDRLGARVWTLCDGRRTVRGIAQALAAGADPADHATPDGVRDIVQDLQRRAVLGPVSDPVDHVS